MVFILFSPGKTTNCSNCSGVLKFLEYSIILHPEFRSRNVKAPYDKNLCLGDTVLPIPFLPEKARIKYIWSKSFLDTIEGTKGPDSYFSGFRQLLHIFRQFSKNWDIFSTEAKRDFIIFCPTIHDFWERKIFPWIFWASLAAPVWIAPAYFLLASFVPKINTEAKRNFATLSDLSVESMDP